MTCFHNAIIRIIRNNCKVACLITGLVYYICNVMNTHPKERIHYLDVTKGVLILLLLLHHFESATKDFSMLNTYFELFTSWQTVFMAFFMQCFFIISGYCSSFDIAPKRFFYKIFRQLLVPWIVFEVLIALFWAFYHSDFSPGRFASFFFTEPCTALWFLNALIFSKTVIYLLRKVIRKEVFILIPAFLLLVASIVLNQYDIGRNYLTIRQSLGACFFVALGSYLKSNGKLYGILLKASLFIYIVMYAATQVFPIRVPYFTASIFVSLRTFPLFLILSTAGSFALLQICKWLDKCSVLEYFGRNTLIVYGLHYCPLYAFIVWYNALLVPVNTLRFVEFILAVYGSELIVCVLLITLFRTRFLSWCLSDSPIRQAR